jgi:hypothetical protein
LEGALFTQAKKIIVYSTEGKKGYIQLTSIDWYIHPSIHPPFGCTDLTSVGQFFAFVNKFWI